MVNDDGTATYLLDITGIMRGQKDRDTLLRVQLSDQVTDTLLGDDIQANGRLVQEDDGGLVQQGSRQSAAHALPQAQLARRCAHVVFDIEDAHQKVAPFAVLIHIQLVDACQQTKGILRRQVIPELRLLAKNGGYMKCQLAPLLPR